MNLCPYCKKPLIKVELPDGRVICNNCDGVLEYHGEDLKKLSEKFTLRCPHCGTYCRAEYCSKCGHEFKKGIDY